MSKFEDKVAEIFRREKIQFKREVSFPDLHGNKKSLLRFDFAVYRNGQLLFLAETDGIQHFKYTPFFHKNKIAFMKQKEWDRRKNSYCLARNIPLIRIPYWDEDSITISSILSNPNYRVISKYHNDNLIQRRGIK